MRTHIDSFTKISKQLKQDYPELTTYESLALAIQIERNQLLENGFVISTADTHPTGLEAIALALGYDNSSR